MNGKTSNIEMTLLLAAAVLHAGLLQSCSKGNGDVKQDGKFTLMLDCGNYVSKSSDPDEGLINDVNIFIYDGWGLEEEHLWTRPDGNGQTSLTLALGKRHSIYAVANAGYRMKDCGQEELKKSKLYISSPDAYGHGMLMAGMLEDFTVPMDGCLELKMVRLMSKLSIRVDRSKLRDDVEFYVSSIKVGNCPRCARPFSPSPVRVKSDLFTSGFYKGGDGCADLNWENADGISDAVDVYLFEHPADSLDPVTSPYLEMQIDYMSDYWHSSADKALTYRFYLRENDSFRVERNCHYKVTVRPLEDGLLCDDSWRVDKSGLTAVEGAYYMKIVPDGTMVDGTFYPYYYEMAVNESRHFELDLFPRDMAVSFREDLVEDEKNEGRAEYKMDSDGKGFTVRALGRKCLSSMVLIPSSPLSEEDEETIMISVK